MALQNKFFRNYESLLVNNVIISGGHFRLFFTAGNGKAGIREELNSGTLKSFEYAVNLYLSSARKNLKAGLGILINDMGSSCEEDACNLRGSNFSRENYRLPQDYQNVLKLYGLNEYPVEIFWEKHARNTGKKYFLKILRGILPGSGLPDGEVPGSKLSASEKMDIPGFVIKKETNGYYLMDPGYYEKIMLTRTSARDKYGTPACPLIMAGLGIIQSRSYTSSINFYYTGSDNTSNVPNYFVIEKGKRVSELFKIGIGIENIYFSNF